MGESAGAWICPVTPSSYEIKNLWSYAAAPSAYFGDVDRNNFAFDLLCLIKICSSFEIFFHATSIQRKPRQIIPYFFRCGKYLTIYTNHIQGLFTVAVRTFFLYNEYLNKHQGNVF